MARPPNKAGTTVVKVSTTPQLHQMLLRLVDSGLYGKSPSEAAERLIADQVHLLLVEGVVLRNEVP